MAAKERSRGGCRQILAHVHVWARLLAVAIVVGAIPAVVHAGILVVASAPENSPLGLGGNPALARVGAELPQATETPLESAFGYGQLASDSAYATRGAATFGARTLGAAEVRVLQTGGNRITAATAKALNEQAALNLNRREWGRALEALKEANTLPRNHHGKVLGTGDYADTAGNIIGSIFDYIKGGL